MSFHRTTTPDKVGGRQPETRRAGCIRAKSFGLRPMKSIGLAKPLVPNSLWQNASYLPSDALACNHSALGINQDSVILALE